MGNTTQRQEAWERGKMPKNIFIGTHVKRSVVPDFPYTSGQLVQLVEDYTYRSRYHATQDLPVVSQQSLKNKKLDKEANFAVLTVMQLQNKNNVTYHIPAKSSAQNELLKIQLIPGGFQLAQLQGHAVFLHGPDYDRAELSYDESKDFLCSRITGNYPFRKALLAFMNDLIKGKKCEEEQWLIMYRPNDVAQLGRLSMIPVRYEEADKQLTLAFILYVSRRFDINDAVQQYMRDMMAMRTMPYMVTMVTQEGHVILQNPSSIAHLGFRTHAREAERDVLAEQIANVRISEREEMNRGTTGKTVEHQNEPAKADSTMQRGHSACVDTGTDSTDPVSDAATKARDMRRSASEHVHFSVESSADGRTLTLSQLGLIEDTQQGEKDKQEDAASGGGSIPNRTLEQEGSFWVELFEEEDDPLGAYEEMLEATQAGKQWTHRLRLPLRMCRGYSSATSLRRMYHDITINKMRDPATNVTAYIVVQNDVTDAEEAAQRVRRMARRELELLTDMLPTHVLTKLLQANHEHDDGRRMSRSTSGITLGLLGQGCVDDLATYHPCVCVMFADIKGFTAMSQSVHPREVMHFLNALYSQFDDLLEEYGVYKVETIGDSYMVASGLLDTSDSAKDADQSCPQAASNADKMIKFAQSMLAAAATVVMPGGKPVQMRVGVHVGPVMSGVVGQKMMRFCLFGDTVNTASRMETTGHPDTIHVSNSVAELLPQYEWKSMGGVEVKGKGVLETYTLVGANKV